MKINYGKVRRHCVCKLDEKRNTGSGLSHEFLINSNLFKKNSFL